MKDARPGFTLARKIPAAIVGAAVLAALAVGTVGYVLSRSALHDAVVERFEALTQVRSDALQAYLATIREDLTIVASNPATARALEDFERGFRAIGEDGDALAMLQRLYIEDNPHALGEKHRLDFAADGSAYSDTHRAYHPWFREMLETRGYYDIFLFSLDGDLVYTVFKELDYATNLNTGEWKDTDLGNVFRAALAKSGAGEVAFFDFRPYDPSHGAPASFIGAPIFRDGRAIGVLAFQMPIDRMNAVMQESTGMGATGETYIVGADGLMRSDSRFAGESTILSRRLDSEAVRGALAGASGWVEGVDARGIDILSVYQSLDFEGTRWAIIGQIDLAEAMSPAVAMRNNMALATLVVLAVMAVFGVVFARRMTRPMTAMAQTMQQLAAGETGMEIPAAGRRDELGEMAASVEIFRQNLVRTRQMEAEAKEQEQRARDQQHRMMNETADRFEQAVGELVDTIGAAARELESAAESMSATADATSSEAATVASAATEASANVQTVAAASEEMAMSIREISTQVQNSTRSADSAVSGAEQATATVRGLAEAGERIGEVVQMIREIAEQTNLLALNATIEAARAGEAGRGFAVVASEVKNLATQTSKATEEIAAQIAAMQASTGETVVSIERINGMIAESRDIAATIASAVEEQNATTAEIARNVQEASNGTAEVTRSIQHVTEAASQGGATAARVLDSARELGRIAERLKQGVDGFMAQVRAA